ncbi:pyridine nucleotide-disulfide oxidoreductase-domain-containing protein [Thermothelomyces heterothallicus CBS 202.75]|uniref:pyridine nucleotide-disulfide oxidoreductase-domain-containing protein n=1 Tax=Thermothelomyces heterothallicus CBS 202.75 TaxID=1149848 RepID=UPI003742285D
MQSLTGRFRGCLRTGCVPLSSPASQQFLRPGSLFWLAARRKNSAQATQNRADAIVVGAGPAGIAAVGNLVDKYPRGNVVWVDKSFDGGSIGQLYREVPSFSPAGNFLEYATALPIFRGIADAVPRPNAVTRLQALDPNMTCSLSHAADMLQLLSDGLIRHPSVKPVLGTVTEAGRNSSTRQWRVAVQPNHDIGHVPHQEEYHAPLVVLCTGTLPRAMPLPAPVSRLGLETCLSPTRLARLLPRDRDRTVAVLGHGYAAAVVLKNLFCLAASSYPRLRVRWFAPGPEPWPDGALLPQSGEVAEFARAVLGADDGSGGGGDGRRQSEAGRFIERVVLPASQERAEAVLREGLLRAGGVDYAVECSGFRRARLPELRPGVAQWTKLAFDPETGSFGPYRERSDKVIGLFGAGSAFPGWGSAAASRERETAGVLESLQYVERMLPAWVDATKRGYWWRRGKL